MATYVIPALIRTFMAQGKPRRMANSRQPTLAAVVVVVVVRHLVLLRMVT